ncbi:MAG: hypothetical protein QM775_09400 [Pirellulales bacterium]
MRQWPASASSAFADSETRPDFAARWKVSAVRSPTSASFPITTTSRAHEIDELAKLAASQNADALVCTHKDLVKVRLDALAGKPLWAVVVGLEFLAGQAELEKLLEPLVSQEGNDQ